MTPSLRAQTIAEWNDLGFWYDGTSESGWVIRGSRNGIEKLAALFEGYAKDPRNRSISGHEHYGPYMYLKVVTSESPEITPHSVCGTLEDFVSLASIIRQKLSACPSGGSFTVGREFSFTSSAEMTLYVEPDTFEPGAYDAQFYA